MIEPIEIKTVVETTDANDKLNELAEALTRLSEAEEDSASGLETLSEAEIAAGKATQTFKTQQEAAMTAVKGLTPVVGNMNGALGAFGTIAKASGDSGKEFAEGLQKVQMGMALTQQLGSLANGLAGAKKAFAAFNAVVAANPIMIIVIAIAALIAGIIALVSWWNSEESQLEQLNKTYEAHAEHIDKVNRANKQELRMAELNGKSKMELLKIEQRQNAVMRANSEQRLINLKLQRMMMEQSGKAKEDIERVTEEIDKETKALEDLNKKSKDLADDIEYQVAVDAKAEEQRTETTRKEANERNKIRQKELDAQKKAYKDALAALNEYENKIKYDNLTQEDQLNVLKQQQVELQKVLNNREDLLKTTEGVKKLLDTEKELNKNLKEQSTLVENIKGARQKQLDLKSLQEKLENIEVDVDAKIKFDNSDVDTQREIIMQNMQTEIDAIEMALDTEEMTTERRLELTQQLYDKKFEYLTLYNQAQADMDNEQVQRDIDRIAKEEENKLLALEQTRQMLAEANQLAEDSETFKRGLEGSTFAYNKSLRLKELADKIKDETDEKKRKQRIAEFSIELAGSVAGAMTRFIKDEGKAKKASAMVDAGVNTAVGIMKTISQFGLPWGAIPAAAVGAMGAVQIAAIAKADPETGSVEMPNMPVAETPVTDVHENMTEYEYEQQKMDQKVYVLVDDINDGQGRKAEIKQDYSY